MLQLSEYKDSDLDDVLSLVDFIHDVCNGMNCYYHVIMCHLLIEIVEHYIY
jgi:hypothetical protein